MITEIIYPPKLNPARNPIDVVLQTDNWITTAGVKAERKFAFNAGANAADQLTIVWGGTNSVTFVFVASPDDSGIQLTAYSSGSLVAWVIQVVAEMNRNYILTKYFITTYAGLNAGNPTISMIAKSTGSQYSLGVAATPTGYVAVSFVTGVDEERRPNFRIIVDIQYEGSYGGEDWETLVTVDPVPDDLMRVTLDLAEICSGKLSSDLPPFNWTTLLFADLMRKRFRLRYCEYEDGTYFAVTDGDAFHAIRAGIDPVLWPAYDFPKKKKFLSWWPVEREKQVTSDQHEYLYFLLDDNTVTQLQLQAEAVWTDGTTTTAIMLASPPLQDLDITIWPAGPEQLGLPALQPSKVLDSYSLVLLDQSNDPISETRAYRLDYHDWPNVRHLLFRNSLGGIETVILTGVEQKDVKVERIITQRILPPAYAPTDPQFSTTFQRGEVTVSAKTGWHTRDIADYLRDALLNTEAWEVGTDRYTPVVIATSKLQIADDLQDLWGLQLEYYAAYNSHSFTGV